MGVDAVVSRYEVQRVTTTVDFEWVADCETLEEAQALADEALAEGPFGSSSVAYEVLENRDNAHAYVVYEAAS